MNLNNTLALLLVTLSANALADGPYVVAQVTHSNLSLDKSTFNYDLTAAGAAGLISQDDGSGYQWRLQGGYKFNRYFALEGGYIDLGTTSYSANYIGGYAKGKEKAGGLDLVALGILPVTQNLSFFGKAGLIAAKVTTDVNSTAPAMLNISDSSTDVRPLFGAGFMYQINKNVDLRLDFDHVSGMGGSGKNGSFDGDMISVGVVYNF